MHSLIGNFVARGDLFEGEFADGAIKNLASAPHSMLTLLSSAVLDLQIQFVRFPYYATAALHQLISYGYCYDSSWQDHFIAAYDRLGRFKPIFGTLICYFFRV